MVDMGFDEDGEEDDLAPNQNDDDVIDQDSPEEEE